VEKIESCREGRALEGIEFPYPRSSPEFEKVWKVQHQAKVGGEKRSSAKASSDPNRRQARSIMGVGLLPTEVGEGMARETKQGTVTSRLQRKTGRTISAANVKKKNKDE